MRRRFQFSLRTLLLTMLVVGAFFGGRQLGIREEHERFRAKIEAEEKRRSEEIVDLMKKWTARPRKKSADEYVEIEAILDDMQAEMAR